MELSNLRAGDIVFFSLDGINKIGMYLEETIVANFKPALAIMGSEMLTCMPNDMIEKSIVLNIFRCEDQSLAQQAAEKISLWLTYRLPLDAIRESGEKDYSLLQSQSLFASQGFYNLVKFAIREASNQPLTRQKVDQRGRGLRMTHLILLAFQISCVEENVAPSKNAWFSLKDFNYDERCFSDYIPANLIEKLSEVFRISGKYLSVDDLREHFLQHPACFNMINPPPEKALSF